MCNPLFMKLPPYNGKPGNIRDLNSRLDCSCRLPDKKACFLKFISFVCCLIIILKPLTAFSITDIFYFPITLATCKIQLTVIQICSTVPSAHRLVDFQAIIGAISYTKKMITFVLRNK